MDLKSLFEMQKVLDYRIEQEHPREGGEDRLGKKLLALQVELGELANELPQTFKFWSNKKNDYKKALVEYVDCLHFVLSIGLEMNIKTSLPDGYNDESITEMFSWVFSNVSRLDESLEVPFTELESRGVYYDLMQSFLGLGKSLGFTFEQIQHAYLSKNKINHERQNNGY